MDRINADPWIQCIININEDWLRIISPYYPVNPQLQNSNWFLSTDFLTQLFHNNTNFHVFFFFIRNWGFNDFFCPTPIRQKMLWIENITLKNLSLISSEHYALQVLWDNKYFIYIYIYSMISIKLPCKQCILLFLIIFPPAQ